MISEPYVESLYTLFTLFWSFIFIWYPFAWPERDLVPNGSNYSFSFGDFWSTLRGHNSFVRYPIQLKFYHEILFSEIYNFHVGTENQIIHLHSRNYAQSRLMEPCPIKKSDLPHKYQIFSFKHLSP